MMNTTKKDLFEALREMNISNRPLIRDQFAKIIDERLCVCPLTNLVIEEGYLTEDNVKSLLEAGNPDMVEQPLIMEVMGHIEKEFENGEHAGHFIGDWDSSEYLDFKYFMRMEY